MAVGSQPEDIMKRINATLECSICMETYTDPRILDCVHSFCFKCIRTHVGNSTVIKCPLCNNESPLPVGTGIGGLKSNFFIKGLIDDMMHQEEKKVEFVRGVCGSCDLGNMAKCHCHECDCELCDQCIKLHRQLKVLKLHTLTLYPTDEEIKAQKEVTVNRKITGIQNNIAATISELRAKISQVQVKIQGFNNKRDTTISHVNEAYQRFCKEIESYVQVLTSIITENAEKRIGDLPDQLKAYERQLNTYQTLEKQQKCMLNVGLDEKVKLCKELEEQIKTHKDRANQRARFFSSKRYVYPPRLEFVSENKEIEIEPLLEQAIGFLTPIKSRHERKVDILRKDLPNDMAEYAVECAHEALDTYGMCRSTRETLNNIGKDIIDRYVTRYNRCRWSCFVIRGDFGGSVCCDKFLSFSIDGYKISLVESD